MPMYDPSHPGRIVHDNMEEMRWTPAEFAQRLGVDCAALSKFLDGRAPVSPEIALALERLGWSDAAFWQRVQASYDEAQIRMKTEPPPVWEDISEIPPEDLPHPGIYIRNGADEAGWTPDDLANALGIPLSRALDLLNARAPVTPEIARALEGIGWGDADHWLLNQRSHDESQAILREKAEAASPQKIGAA